MEHVVFFPAHDGTPAFRRVASLEDAVRLVEHLRNVEGVSELSVHALTEVPLAFRAVYKVEVPAQDVPSMELPPPLPVADAAPAHLADAPVPAVEDAPVPALAASNGHAESAPSSLGFFAS
jgi:hypothetical protein